MKLEQIVSLSILSATATVAAAQPFQISRIETPRSSKHGLSFFGNTLAWSDGRSGGSDIYKYDLSNNTETRITDGTFPCHSPAVSNQGIAWLASNFSRVQLWTPQHGVETISSNSWSYYDSPTMSGETIVWHELDNFGQNRLYKWNRQNGEQILNVSTPDVWNSIIFDNKIVYGGSPNGSIQLYDLVTAEDRLVVPLSAGSTLTNLDFANGGIVFGTETILPDLRYDLYYSDLSGNLSLITSSSDFTTQFQVFGENVVWTDAVTDNIMLWNQNLGIQQITNSDSSRRSPVIYENTIAWLEQSNGTWDIYTTTIPTPSTVGALGLAGLLATKRKRYS